MLKYFANTPTSIRVLCLSLILTFSAAVLCPSFINAQEAEDIQFAQDTQTSETSGIDICTKAKADKKVDGGGGGYFFAGFFCGLIGFIIAAVSGGDPPAERLIGMNPTEATLYVDCYKSAKRGTQMKYAGIGWVAGAAIALTVIFTSHD